MKRRQSLKVKTVSVSLKSLPLLKTSFAIAIALLFSGEETYGRYLDLHTNHTAYNNIKHIKKRISYLQYLDVLALAEHDLVHQEIPKEARTSKEYEK